MRAMLYALATVALVAPVAGPAAAQVRPGYDGGSYRAPQPPAADDEDDAPPPPSYQRQPPAPDGYDRARNQRSDEGSEAEDGEAVGGQASAADLVRQLGLRADQQSAFREYQAAFQASQDQVPLDDPARLQAMTAPQRLDATAQQMQRDQADFARVAAATRRFYAALDPAQRRTFDRLTAPPLQQDESEDVGSDAPGRPAAPAPPRR